MIYLNVIDVMADTVLFTIKRLHAIYNVDVRYSFTGFYYVYLFCRKCGRQSIDML